MYSNDNNNNLKNRFNDPDVEDLIIHNKNIKINYCQIKNVNVEMCCLFRPMVFY